MKPVAVVAQPCFDLGRVMVGRVVVNQEYLLAAVAIGQAIKKGGVSLAIEHRFPLNEMNLGPPNVHRPENLLGVALARSGNEWLASTSRPGLIQGGVLAKTGLVGEQQCRATISGFF